MVNDKFEKAKTSIDNIFKKTTNEHFWMNNCLIIQGTMDMRTLSKVLGQAGKLGFDLDIKAAGNAQALMVMGESSNLNELKYRSEEFAKFCRDRWAAEVDAGAGESGYYETLSASVRNWLEKGEHGNSAWSIFNNTAGKDIRGFTDGECETKIHPLDISDFKRCAHLVASVPETKAQLDSMRDISVEWSSIVDHWDYFESKVFAPDADLKVLNAEFQDVLHLTGSSPLVSFHVSRRNV